MKKIKILLVGSLLLGTIIFSQGLSETKKVSAAEGDTYELVTDASTLSVGDTLVIASNTKGVTLGALSNDYFTATQSIFSENKNEITDLKSGLELVLSGTKDKWELTYNNKKIGATAAKKMSLTKGTNTWKISIDTKNNATIYNTNSSYGRFLHNVGSTRFTTYTSATSTSMLLPQLYRKVVDLSIKHDVNYVTNCDTKLEPKQFAEGAEITLPTEKLIKDGYIFDGWYTDSEFKNKFVEGTKMGTQDVTLYANWILDTSTKYTVKFMLNDGTESVYTSVIAKENETIEAPTAPTREGFKFTAWYTNIELTEEFNFSTSVTNDLVLYAGWKVYTISTYTKVTSNLDDWSGKYLIVYEKENVCFNGSLDLDNIDTENNTKQVTIENNNIIGDYENYQFNFEKKDTGYSIKSYSNIFIGKTAYSNGLDSKKENKFINSVSMSSNGILTIKSSGGTVLKYNSSIDQKRFRFYKSGQSDISLFKLEEKPTIDETTLTSYTSTLSIDNSKAIRFIGSVKETEFDKISKIGFNFTLTLDNDKGNPISKEYSSDVTKLYKTINDSNTGTFDKTEAVYEKDGFLNFSLILKNLPKDLLASIYYYSYAVIDGKTYNSPTTEVVIAGDLIEFR